MIIVLRPCLVLSAVIHREQANSKGDEKQSIGPEWVQWLDDTSSLCSRVASHVILLFSQAIRTNPAIRVSIRTALKLPLSPLHRHFISLLHL
jgi:hypothetical protein